MRPKSTSYLTHNKSNSLNPRSVGKLRNKTIDQYQQVIAECREVFYNKTKDYGTAWRILRLSSITDQIFIKAQRIRTLQEKPAQKVDEGQADEFIGILNYCIMALVQASLPDDAPMELGLEEVMRYYDEEVDKTITLLEAKNHDYDEAWRDMRISSITDIILMKLLRTRQIEGNQGKTIISEGVEANYRDMINYAAFCLIKLKEVHT